jgi:hypothetical protein
MYAIGHLSEESSAARCARHLGPGQEEPCVVMAGVCHEPKKPQIKIEKALCSLLSYEDLYGV